MAKALLTPQSQIEFEALPVIIRKRVLDVFVRLQEWPQVSGVKWLKHDWTGHARIRAGD
jgi:hypothetical protein